ncbi:aldose 1-epimerase family protein [Joostella sp. CR20]|uniref:aldose 1-epimerase family protein n=1 Tax=Joostella sp. CR20 TaxID=2804312 RepID=UPI00313C4098
MKNIEKLTIKNRFLQIEITKIGAEICSIKNNENQEFIWQANPAIWGSSAPVLFPIIGGLKNNEFYYEGKAYSVPKHGFIRHNEDLTVINHLESSITFQYKYNTETLKNYPFKFDFQLTFSVTEKTVTVSHKITNDGTNDLLFSLGGHPAFKCPLTENENYEDYFLEFEHSETSDRYLINEKGLQNGKTAPCLQNTDTLPLNHELFSNDALIFKDLKSRKISLAHQKNGKVLTVSYPDFNYVGIWAKPNGDFVCIEPWLGITDHNDTTGVFSQKEGILSLAPQKEFIASYAIEIYRA